MLELKVGNNIVMTLDDNNKTIIHDQDIANDVAFDINGKKIDFEVINRVNEIN